MSGNYLTVIPTDPYWRPSKDAADRAAAVLSGMLLLVRVSFHPRWRVEGADGPYLVSPALMMVVPRQREVRLVYGRTASDFAGLALTVATLLVLAVQRRAPAWIAAWSGRASWVWA